MRVDVWARDAEKELLAFTGRLLRWLRHLSAQTWIADYEFHTDTTIKHQFPIDAGGGALETPFTLTRFTTPEAAAQTITATLFQQAVDRAAAADEPPTYWQLFYDGQNYHARDNYERVALMFALSLEVARDTIFPRFCPTQVRPGLGTLLRAPFDDTDLLKHLTSALETHHGRNLKKEEPAAWLHVKSLYIARHHVAHGKPAVIPTASGPKPVSQEVIKEWIPAVRVALAWIETL